MKPTRTNLERRLCAIESNPEASTNALPSEDLHIMLVPAVDGNDVPQGWPQSGIAPPYNFRRVFLHVPDETPSLSQVGSSALSSWRY